jgi:hypothetical protein
MATGYVSIEYTGKSVDRRRRDASHRIHVGYMRPHRIARLAPKAQIRRPVDSAIRMTLYCRGGRRRRAEESGRPGAPQACPLRRVRNSSAFLSPIPTNPVACASEIKRRLRTVRRCARCNLPIPISAQAPGHEATRCEVSAPTGFTALACGRMMTSVIATSSRTLSQDGSGREYPR